MLKLFDVVYRHDYRHHEMRVKLCLALELIQNIGSKVGRSSSPIVANAAKPR